MRPVSVLLGAVALLACACISARADFVNGQAADLVLWQSGFQSKTAPVPPTASSLRGPYAVAVDPVTKKVFVADTGNHRILRFAGGAALANGAAAEGVIGQANFTSNAPNSGNTVAPVVRNNSLSTPKGLAFDGAGRLYVADTGNNRVLRFDAPAGSFSPSATAVFGQATMNTFGFGSASTAMNAPSGVATDADGRLWVADTLNHRVLRFDAAAAVTTGPAANAVLGQTGFGTSSPSRSASRFDSPLAVAVSGGGTLWVADTANDRVLRFKGAATLLNGANADGVLGQRDFTTRETIAGRRGIRSPGGLAVDAGGRLFASSQGSNRVTWLDRANGAASFAPWFGLLGQPTFSDVVGETKRRKLHQPIGLALDGTKKLWVVDFQNVRALRFRAQ